MTLKLATRVTLRDSPWNYLVQNTGVGSLSLLQGTFPTQGLNPGLPYCKQILYQLSRKGSLSRQAEWSITNFMDEIMNTHKGSEKVSYLHSCSKYSDFAKLVSKSPMTNETIYKIAS